MPIVASKVTVATTPTLLASVGRSVEGGDSWVEVVNTGGAAIFLGGSDVSTTTGRSLAASASVLYELATGDALYAVGVASVSGVTLVRNHQ